MSDGYEVGYGKPPKKHQFGPGNQAARKRKKRSQALSIPDVIDKALRTRRKIKRGDQVMTMEVAEVMVERLVQIMTTGSAKDLIAILTWMEKHAPRALTQQLTEMTVHYRRAEGSSVPSPSADLWGTAKC